MSGKAIAASTNHVGAAPKLKAPSAERFAAFDSLPPALRAALRECAMPWAPKRVLADYREATARLGAQGALVFMLSVLQYQDEQELRRWAKLQEAETGQPYPHLAAGAFILRYDERDRQKGARR